MKWEIIFFSPPRLSDAANAVYQPQPGSELLSEV